VAEADLYIDCDSAKVVTSDTDNTLKALPRIAYGDTILLNVYLLKGYSRASAYDIIPTDGLTLEVRILEGLLTGSTAVEDVLAFQGTWTAQDGDHFQAALALNTAEILAALGNANSFDATFETKYFRSGVPTTVLQQSIKVWRASDPNSVMPVAEPTPLSAEAAQAAFVQIVESRAYYIKGANGTLIKLWNDDSSGSAVFKAESVS
jgi:hypothetical protein